MSNIVKYNQDILNYNIPPHNKIVEESIITAMFNDEAYLLSILERISENDFYIFSNKKLFKIIQSLNQCDIDISLVTVYEFVIKLKLQDKITAHYISELVSQLSINPEHNINILLEYSLKRKIIKSANYVLKYAYTPGYDAFELMEKYQNDASNILNNIVQTEIHDNKYIAKTALKEVENYMKNKISGIPTPNKLLNIFMQGGFQNTDLIYIAGRPSIGKTAYIIDCINHIKENIYFISIESSTKQMAMRLLSNYTGYDSYQLKGIKNKKISSEDFMIINKYLSELYDKSNLFINDNPFWDIHKLRLDIKKTVKKHNIKIVFIDYLQIINCNDKNINNRNDEVGRVSQTLKIIAKENNIPVVCLCQLNRQVESRAGKRPQLSDLKESGNIEQDADVVIMPYSPAKAGIKEIYYNDNSYNSNDFAFFDEIIELIIVKMRDGETGSEYVRNNKSIFQFRSIDFYSKEPEYVPPGLNRHFQEKDESLF